MAPKLKFALSDLAKAAEGPAPKVSDAEAKARRAKEWREPILRADVNSWLKKHGLRER